MKKRYIVYSGNSFYDQSIFIFPTKKEALKKFNECIDSSLFPNEVDLVCEDLIASNHESEDF